MEKEEGEGASDWNEQRLFADEYFAISRRCRGYQESDQLFEWKFTIVSKISATIGVCSANEKESLWSVVDTMNEYASKVVAARPRRHYLYNKPKLYRIARNDFREILFGAEAEVDTIANKHMPFLRKKKEFDLGKW